MSRHDGTFALRATTEMSSASLEQATAQTVAEPVAEARSYVQEHPAMCLDETGWREGQQRARM
jgi:hypothetical protein